MEHADRFLRRFYIEKGMFGSLSLTFIFYRPPLSPLFGIIYSYKYKALSFFALLYNSKLHAEKNRQIRDELEQLCRLRRPFSTYVRHIETMRTLITMADRSYQ